MKHRRTFLMMTVLTVLVLAAAPAMAQGWGGGGGNQRPGPAERMERMAEQLGLSDTQRAEFEEAAVVHHESMQLTREQTRDARDALDAQVADETFDEQAIRDAAANLALLEADRAVAEAEFLQVVRGIFTDEQYEQFLEMRQQRNRFGPGGGQRPGRGGNGYHGGRQSGRP